MNDKSLSWITNHGCRFCHSQFENMRQTHPYVHLHIKRHKVARFLRNALIAEGWNARLRHDTRMQITHSSAVTSSSAVTLWVGVIWSNWNWQTFHVPLTISPGSNDGFGTLDDDEDDVCILPTGSSEQPPAKPSKNVKIHNYEVRVAPLHGYLCLHC